MRSSRRSSTILTAVGAATLVAVTIARREAEAERVAVGVAAAVSRLVAAVGIAVNAVDFDVQVAPAPRVFRAKAQPLPEAAVVGVLLRVLPPLVAESRPIAAVAAAELRFRQWRCKQGTDGDERCGSPPEMRAHGASPGWHEQTVQTVIHAGR